MNVKKYNEWCEYYDRDGLELKLLRSKINFFGKKVLDIGCGTGRLSYRILPFVKEVIGVDIEKEAIDICEMKKRDNVDSYKAKFQVKDTNNLAFLEKSVDIVIFSWSIYLILKKERLLTNIKKFLNDGGYVIVLQPIAGDFEETLFHFYRRSNLSEFAAHSSESLRLLNKIFNNCSEDILKAFFTFPTIEKTIEMIEFFIQDEDFRLLSSDEKTNLRNKLINYENKSGEIIMSDIVKMLISQKTEE